MREQGGKTAGDLGFDQHLEQLLQAQGLPVVQPAQRQQRGRCFDCAADFRVVEFACPVQRPLAHDHAHQQGLAGFGQTPKIREKALLFVIEHVAIARLQPIEHTAEVVQVIEGIVEGLNGHGCTGQAGTSTGYTYRTACLAT
ncbi:hypothetical protein D3C76_657040 [compost metagenome]